jgi:hypothetical protein
LAAAAPQVKRRYAALGGGKRLRPFFTLETGALPNTVAALTKAVSDALTQATGYPPNSIAVTSAGQTAPDAPKGPVDRVLGSVEDITQTALGGVFVSRSGDPAGPWTNLETLRPERLGTDVGPRPPPIVGRRMLPPPAPLEDLD